MSGFATRCLADRNAPDASVRKSGHWALRRSRLQTMSAAASAAPQAVSENWKTKLHKEGLAVEKEVQAVALEAKLRSL